MSKKEEIIEAAKKIFSEYGIEKTTLEDIAGKCGMKKSSLYYYFKNKENIFSEVVNSESKQLEKILKLGLEKKCTPREKLYNHMITRLNRLKEMKHYRKIMIDLEEGSKFNKVIKKERAYFVTFEVGILQFILNEGIEKGVFRIESPKSLSYVLMAVLMGFEFPIIIENMEFDFNREINSLLNVIFNGIEIKNGKV